MTVRRRVAVVPAWYPSERQPVLGSFVREKARALALFHDVAVIYVDPSEPRGRPGQVVSDRDEEGIRTIRVRGRPGRLRPAYLPAARDLRAGWRALVGSAFSPELIHAHVFTAGVGAVGLGLMKGLPVIVSENYTGFPRGTVHGLQRHLAGLAFGRADAVCPASDDLRRHIESLGIAANFEVVPNAVDVSLFRPAPGDAVERRMLLVALLDDKKGVPDLLRAFARVRPSLAGFALDVVGDGPGRPGFERLADRLGVADAVRFHGLKGRAEVAAMMQRSAFLVLPSRWENLPNVVIEAMACGLPVLATAVGGVPELVDDRTGRLVPPGDPEALERGLAHMAEHHRDLGGEPAVLRARERYSLEAVGRRFSEIYEEVLAGRRERRRLRRAA